MTSKSSGHSYATLSALAALAFMSACVAHEVIGHGGLCLALGGQIVLVSSVYFRATNGGPAVDAAGPLMNLVVGALCWLSLRTVPRLSAHWRLFLVFTLAFNLFWGAGYFLFSAVTNTGDWAFVLRDLAFEPRWLGLCAMGALGVCSYYASMQLVESYLPQGTPLVLPYLVAGAVSCVAAFFFAGPILPAVRQAAWESLGAGVGLLLLGYRNARRKGPPSQVVFVSYSNRWLLVAAVAVLLFFATLGRGLVIDGHV